MSRRRYVALAGCRKHFEPKLLKPGLMLKLVKEPNNLHDEEAIRVELEPFGKVGYIANSIYTVPRGCSSAGRIYDTFNDLCYAVVRFVIEDMAILQLVKSYKMQIEISDDSYTHKHIDPDPGKYESKERIKEDSHSISRESGAD